MRQINNHSLIQPTISKRFLSLQYGLEWYLHYWYKLETIRTTKSEGEYKDLCRYGIISTIMTAICFGGSRRAMGWVSSDIEQQNTWDASLDGDRAGIDDIDKTYYGSHH